MTASYAEGRHRPGRRVRSYVLTGGRTDASGVPEDATVVRVDGASARARDGSREHQALVACCEAPQTLAVLQRSVRLPLGVVRVLVDELVTEGVLRLMDPGAQPQELAELDRRLVNARRL
ncbi:MAG: DUF742 domain-containing protein [Egibacteraceae bacterium]